MDPQQTHASMQPRIQHANEWVPDRHTDNMLMTGCGQYYNAAPVPHAEVLRRQNRALLQAWPTNPAYTQPQQNRTDVWVPAEVRHLDYTLLEGNQAPEESGTDHVTQYEGIPTAKRMLESLPYSVVLPLHVGSTDCVICLDEMCEDNTTTKLPCGHIFHRCCIVFWLCNHNTCPSCRFKLPAKCNGISSMRYSTS